MSGLVGHDMSRVETSLGGVSHQQKKRSGMRVGSEGRVEQSRERSRNRPVGGAERKPWGPVLMWSCEAVLCRCSEASGRTKKRGVGAQESTLFADMQNK